MNQKDIKEGGVYILSGSKNSNPGCSKEYFEKFRNEEVMVTKILKNFNNKNTVHIHGINEDTLVSFWCSPYDLKEKE